MKFTVNKTTLLREISTAQEIISSRNALTIMSNVLLIAENNRLTIKATDLKVGFETSIPIQVMKEGTTTIFCDKLLNVIKNLPESEIEFIKKDEVMKIKPIGQNIDFKLRCLPSDNFPEIASIDNESYFDIPQNDLLKMINNTIFAMSNDETRYFLNGVYFEKSDNNIKMVATDGRRLSYIESPSDTADFDGVIIPLKVLNLIKKMAYGEGNVSIAIENKLIHLKLDGRKISSNLIDGQFPQYSRITTESPQHKAIVNKVKLSNAIKRVSLLSDSKAKRVFLIISNNLISLSSEENDIGVAKESIECEYQGDEITIALNFEYLLDPLKAIIDNDIDLCFTDSSRPVMIYSSPRTNYLHMIQPMQLD